MPPVRPLWTCLKCEAKLITRNLWHACGPHMVESFLEGKSPSGRALYRRFEELVQKCGPKDSETA